MLIGIVGKANTGKSTFFKALTLSEVEIANYPFATIKPNHGVGYVKIKDVAKDFNTKANPKDGFILGDYRFVPTELLDVAGLVPGAHEGKGLGNQFLNDLNQANALIHIIDVSGGTNEKGEPLPENTYDPAQDVKFLEKELDMWYLQILKRGWEKFAKQLSHEKKQIDKAIAKQLSGLRVTIDMVKQAIKDFNPDPTQWSEEDLLKLATELRIKSKPMIIAANKIDVPKAQENLKKLQKEFPDYKIIPCSSESEVALKEAAKHELIDYTPGENNFEIKGKVNEKQEKALKFIKEFLSKFNTTGVQDILNHIVLDVIKRIAVHPVADARLQDKDGNVLPDCFLVPENTTALGLAFRLHSDIGENFIKAMDMKTKKPVGKDHNLKHLDVIEIMTSK